MRNELKSGYSCKKLDKIQMYFCKNNLNKKLLVVFVSIFSSLKANITLIGPECSSNQEGCHHLSGAVFACRYPSYQGI